MIPVRMGFLSRFISPRKTLAVRSAACGLFPFGLGWQPFARPLSISACIKPTDENHGVVLADFGVEILPGESRRERRTLDEPLLAWVFFGGRTVSRSIDERRELGGRDRVCVYIEGIEMHLVHRLLCRTSS